MRIDVSFRRVGGPPPQKNRFFYFLAVSSNRVYTTSHFDFALMGGDGKLTTFFWMDGADDVATYGREQSARGCYILTCVLIYIWYWYIWLGNPGERVVMRMPLYVCRHFLSSDLIGFFGRGGRGWHIWFRSKEQRIQTQHSLSIDFFVGVGVIVNFRKKRKIPK